MSKGFGGGVLRLVLLAVGVVCALAAPASAGAAPFAIGPPGAWVTPTDIGDIPDLSAQTTNGVAFLLVDRQVRVGTRREETYSRFAKQVTNESGLQGASQMEIEFDPTYQRLTIHSVVVRRGTRAIDRLDGDALHVVQREKRLDAQIYDGRLSAVLFIADVRVGDVVDYAYTLSGADPTLADRYTDYLWLGAPSALGHVRSRVIVPKGRHVTFVPRGPGASDGRLAPALRDRGSDTEYVWDLPSVPAYTVERDAPESFEPLPWVQVTEFDSWSEVARTGARLFDMGSMGGRALDAWVTETRGKGGSGGNIVLKGRDLDDFILAATRFVQDEVRYVAVEVGMSRRRPTNPSTVLDRRYGDCKDKAALLVALLRAGRVQAWPALVSATVGGRLDTYEPSLSLFDHVIVRAVGGDGEVLWIDPTLTLQGGGVERLRYGPFEHALVLDASTAGLSTIEHEPATDPSPFVRDRFRVAMPGSKTETDVDSVREYRGAIADAMRATIRAVTKEDLRKEFLKKYQGDFPGAHDTGPVDVFDDRDRNILRLGVHVAIPDFWSLPDATKPYLAPISAHLLEASMPRPTSVDRQAPLALPFPSRARYEVEAVLPFDLPMDPRDDVHDMPGLHFEFTSRCDQRRLLYTFNVESKQGVVPVGALPEYVAAIDKARMVLGRSLRYTPPQPDGPNWSTIVPLCLLALASIWGALRAYRHNPEPLLHVRPDPRYEGLHGWLLLVALQLLILPVRLAWDVSRIVTLLASRLRWMALTTPQLTSYRPGLAALLVAETLVTVPLTAYAVAVLIVFVRRRRSFRLHFTVVAIAALATYLLDQIGSGKAEANAVTLHLFGTGLWLAYVARSRRVAGTFVM